MGADMIITSFVVKEGDSLEKLAERMREKVNSLTENDREMITLFYDDALYNDESEDYEIEKIKEDFIKVINEGEKVAECRHANWIQHKGDYIYLTGGLSWGDSPTIIFDDFNAFSLLKYYLEEHKELNS